MRPKAADRYYSPLLETTMKSVFMKTLLNIDLFCSIATSNNVSPSIVMTLWYIDIRQLKLWNKATNAAYSIEIDTENLHRNWVGDSSSI